ncbi:MAG: ABC-F family ATP-binding cassette domain-containing protein [Clostridia bacterium]|nr:ABC-F family ATP-binding cassette domain-containing protein [Clostridia bacterium]
MNLVDVKHFSFTYPNAKKVINDLSFSLEKGEMLLLCGNNGCGKSTLLRSLKPETAPKGVREGEMHVCQNSQILFQDCENNIIFRSAYEDLIFPACNSGMPEEKIKEKAAQVLLLFGIEHLKDRDTSTLSGGEKQMLSLAALLMLEPDLLLLDEPLAQLDEQAKAVFLEKLQLVQANGTAIIIAEHNTDDLLERAQKVLIFDNGKNTVYTKDMLPAAGVFPNMPAYVALEQKLKLPVKSFTKQEAVENLRACRENVGITPLTYNVPQTPAVLTCQDVTFSYGDAPVLENLSLQLRQGEIAFLTGANGAGKTTLLSLICGFSTPQSGNICLKKPHRIGYLAQNPVYSFLKDTLIDDFRFLLKQNRLPESKIEELFARYPMFSDLRALLEQNPLDLSGGERAKAAVFKLLLIGKDVLVLDEPEKHLDSGSMEELSGIFRDLAASGVSFLIVSHSPAFLYRTAHSVRYLSKGNLCDYTPQAYCTTLCPTPLYRAIQAADLPLLDIDEAEVTAHG